jgi:HD-GYP domain-containing protein (c-di-GMP phosphodiesterase class II)/methanogenic corrinoid protein MtbC1
MASSRPGPGDQRTGARAAGANGSGGGTTKFKRPGSRLDHVGSEPEVKPLSLTLASGEHSPRRRSALDHVSHASWVVLAVGAAVGAVLAGASAAVVGFLAVLASATMLLGWRLGEDARTALEREINGRSNELKKALSELEIAQAETVRRLSMAIEFRDEDTGAHIERIGRFSTLLAEQIGMDPEFCARLSHAAPLHDVGKVAIPDAILLKPGPLTPAERAIVETHAEEGYRLVRGSSSSILDMAATIALSHQEKWDGSGYPRGLAGEAIPIEGRIVAVADVFDALTSDRVYRKAFSVEDAVKMMREERGHHFDPMVLDAFMEVLGRSGPDAREGIRADPVALMENTLETYATALERGDAEMAEGAIATAIEDGLPPTTLHAEVIAPALHYIGELSEAGEMDNDREHLALSITRRVLATLYRYMLGGTEPTRERVLLAVLQGDPHTLGLQMVHDQLAAAGYHTSFETEVSVEQLLAKVDSQSPDVVILGATMASAVESVARAVRELRDSHPDVPVMLRGAAVSEGLPGEQSDMRVLERIDESVAAVEELLARAVPVPSV